MLRYNARLMMLAIKDKSYKELISRSTTKVHCTKRIIVSKALINAVD